MKKLAYYIINQKCLIYCYLLFSNENFANCCKLKLSENGYKVVNGRLYNNIFESHVIMEPNKVRKDQIDRTANMI